MDASTTTAVPNVYACIAAVSAELAREGIAKNRTNIAQGFAFRGIDDIYNALAPALAKHQLVIIPRILSREMTERQTIKGTVLFSVVLMAEFEFVSAHDGSSTIVRTVGEASDMADKASSKAMSACYKYAALMTFAIPTEADNDPDASSPEAIAAIPKPPAGFDKWFTALQAATDAPALKKVWEGDANEKFRAYAKAHHKKELDAAKDKLKAAAKAAK